jgi:hypothetical protein
MKGSQSMSDEFELKKPKIQDTDGDTIIDLATGDMNIDDITATGDITVTGDVIGSIVVETGDSISLESGSSLDFETGSAFEIAGVEVVATAAELNKNTIVSALYNLGAPILADVDRIVTTANMRVGTYTIAASPDIPRNITVTHTQVGGVTDTLGTIDFVGTDIDDNALTETITPLDATIAVGTKAFKTITSATGVGWVIDTVEDTITIGVGDELGLPVSLASTDNMLIAWADAAFVAVSGTVAGTPTVAETTIDMSAATYDASKVCRVFVSG